MNLLKEIKDNEWPTDKSTLKFREASRAVIFDENDLIPMLFVAKNNYHKLPGGGIDEGEDKLSALFREVKEETGCEMKITGEVGEIIEYRSRFNLKQISYCYLGKITAKGDPDFTKEELSDGFELVWMPLDEAILKVENDKPKDYEGGFIQQRDLKLLQKAKELISAN